MTCCKSVHELRVSHKSAQLSQASIALNCGHKQMSTQHKLTQLRTHLRETGVHLEDHE